MWRRAKWARGELSDASSLDESVTRRLCCDCHHAVISHMSTNTFTESTCQVLVGSNPNSEFPRKLKFLKFGYDWFTFACR